MTEDAGRWRELQEAELANGLEATAITSFRPVELAQRTLPPPHLPLMHLAAGDASTGEHYEVGDEIGQGGQGVVFRARQASLGREVALKVLRSETNRSYFLAEARITGQLDHANIIPVHGLGSNQAGTPHLAMKLVEGQSWRDLIHAGELSLREHLKVLSTVCQAVAFAHEQQVIHRDLKPANVMVGEFGQVFVMDWGLAAGLSQEACERSGIPHVKEIPFPAGTPGYMAPELAEGRGDDQDQRTDVYLLGACLHEVLTRRLRHRGDSILIVLSNAISSTPYRYEFDVPQELADLANRATSADPAFRPPTVVAFREAIEGFLEHEQAAQLAHEAQVLVDRLVDLQGRFAELPASEQEAAEHTLDQLYAEARFAARQALKGWPQASEPPAILAAANAVMARHALAQSDLALAIRLLPELEDPELHEEIEGLRNRLEERQTELEDLRDRARRLDWSAVTNPLGNLFILAAVLGAASAWIGAWALRQPDPYEHLPAAMGSWIGSLLILGVTAVTLFRRGKVPDSLVSWRMFGLWSVVAVACFFNAVISQGFGLHVSVAAAVDALLIGVGLFAMGLQTRPWVLLPAVGWFGGSLLIVQDLDYGIDVFAAVWLLNLGCSGVAMKLGASLEPNLTAS